MVVTECVTATTTTINGSLPTTFVGQRSFTEESSDRGEAEPQEKQTSKENANVVSNTVPSQPQPASVPSSATRSVSASPSTPASVSVVGSGSTSASASAFATTVLVPQRPLDSTGLSSSPPPPQQQPTQSLIQNSATKVKSLSPQPNPPMQAHPHPLHSQGHPPPIHHSAALPPHPYHPSHVFHPRYPPPPHPNMYHPAMWHHPHHHPTNSAAYIKPYSAVMRSRPHVKRTSKYMLMEQGVRVPSPSTKGSHRPPREGEVDSAQPAIKKEEPKEVRRVKRPASELSYSPDREKDKEGVSQDLRNKKMKATDCLLFAASLLATDAKEGNQEASDENAGANGKITPDTSELEEGQYVTTGVKPSKKIFQAPAIPGDDEEKENNENWPKDVDVLCGRGGLINKHPGNVVYRKIVDYNKPFYQSVHKKHRILVSQSIVQSILNFGGRFMIMEKGKDWNEIEFKRAVQKTSQALRERIITEEEKKKEEEETENGESKTSEDDAGAEGENDDDDEGVEEEVVIKSEGISDNRHGIATGTLAI